MNNPVTNVSGIPRSGGDAEGWSAVDRTVPHPFPAAAAVATTVPPFVSHAPPPPMMQQSHHVSVNKARAMLDQLAAASPGYGVDPDLELSTLSVGEIADLCRLQSIELANQGREKEQERGRVRPQPQHEHDRHKPAHDDDDEGYIHDNNEEQSPPSKTYYYEPLNPYRMLSADKLPAMEEARLDIQMKKLYDGLYPYGGTTGTGAEAAPTAPTRKW